MVTFKVDKIVSKLMIIVILTSGCANTTSTEMSKNVLDEESKETEEKVSTAPEKDAIKIEEIDWSIEEIVENDTNCLSFGYTHNSNYTILSVNLKLVSRDGEDNYIKAYNNKITDPTETVGDSPLLFNGSNRVQDVGQYFAMDVDSMSVTFISDDGLVYTERYSYKTKSYTGDFSGTDVHQWSDSKLASSIPEPEFRYTRVESDYAWRFEFNTYGVSEDEFKAYGQTIQENGFSNLDSISDSNFVFAASNGKGKRVKLFYSYTEQRIHGYVETYEEE